MIPDGVTVKAMIGNATLDETKTGNQLLLGQGNDDGKRLDETKQDRRKPTAYA